MSFQLPGDPAPPAPIKCLCINIYCRHGVKDCPKTELWDQRLLPIGWQLHGTQAICYERSQTVAMSEDEVENRAELLNDPNFGKLCGCGHKVGRHRSRGCIGILTAGGGEPRRCECKKTMAELLKQ
jgi:hypothetical protein